VVRRVFYVTGPRAETWFPVLQRVRFRLPWQLKRMQRDFSVMLAILLDAGMPEPEAVSLAADCTANTFSECARRKPWTG